MTEARGRASPDPQKNKQLEGKFTTKIMFGPPPSKKISAQPNEESFFSSKKPFNKPNSGKRRERETDAS